MMLVLASQEFCETFPPPLTPTTGPFSDETGLSLAKKSDCIRALDNLYLI